MLELRDMKPEDIPEAVTLFNSNYRRLRRRVPALPERFESEQPVSDFLAEILSRHYGVTAFEGDRLVGYWTAYRIPQFHGNWKGAYAPEWAHASITDKRETIYAEMYERMCRKWIDDSCITHTLSFMTTDKELKRFSFEKGFGLLYIDSVKEIERLSGQSPRTVIEVAPAGNDDLDALFDLEKKLFHFLLSPPVFRWSDHKPSYESVARDLQKESVRYWVCRQDDRPAGFIVLDLEEHEGSELINDSQSAYIRGLYVEPEFRGRGIGSALLEEACRWASQARIKRCTVDMESANGLSRSFWLTRFVPVCFTAIRKLDDRLYGARTGCF
ncbi:MAG: GNAT family N-acetyltransferase [Spirochaetia bacterium]